MIVSEQASKNQSNSSEDTAKSICYSLFNYAGYKLIVAYDKKAHEMITPGDEYEDNDHMTKKTKQKSLLRMILILIITLVMCFVSAFEITPEGTTQTQTQNDQTHAQYSNQNDWMQQRESIQTYLPQSEPMLLNSRTLVKNSPKSLTPTKKKSLQRPRRRNHSMKPFNMIKNIVFLPINIFMNVFSRVLHLFKLK
jgi:hypothetical protein